MEVSAWTSMEPVNALQATRDSTVSLVGMMCIILSSLINVEKKNNHCKITDVSDQDLASKICEHAFLSLRSNSDTMQ